MLQQGQPISGARFVDPQILARIGNLDLLARTVVDGFINGLHRAPYFGASIDFAEHFKRRSVLVLISDFYEDPDAVLEAIKPLRFIGNELLAFHVLDPAEIQFDYTDASAFEDLESGEQLPVVPESFGDEYRKLIADHVNALSTKFSEHRIDYTLMNTSEPLDRALFSYLSSREKLMRVR